MAGVVAVAYDFGVVCSNCSLTNELTPLRFKAEFEGILNTNPSIPELNGTFILPQLVGLPCQYSHFDPGTTFHVPFLYGPFGGPSGSGSIFWRRLTGAIRFFENNFLPGCLIEGTFENAFTEVSPSGHGYYGGTCTLSVV
jgi:hypothetical protein